MEPANPVFAGQTHCRIRSGRAVLQGLYKFTFVSERGTGSGVMFATGGGRMYGGDSNFCFSGNFSTNDGVIAVELQMSRHNHDPKLIAMFDLDRAVLRYTGTVQGEEVHFDGHSEDLPGVHFRTILTRINDSDAPPPGKVGADGISNGLYSIHIRMLDGIDAGNTGVMMLHDGSIRGGDAFFDYIGAYSSANGKWKGELVNREHTPARGERPLFSGHEVGIGFSGIYDGDGAIGEAVALAGKRSIRFRAVLRKLVVVED